MPTNSTETKLRKPIIEALQKCGGLVVPYVGSVMNQNGTADIFLAHVAWSGWIEFKGPHTDIKPLQERFRQQMNLREVRAIIMRLYPGNLFSLDDVTEIFPWYTGYDIIRRLVDYGPHYTKH